MVNKAPTEEDLDFFDMAIASHPAKIARNEQNSIPNASEEDLGMFEQIPDEEIKDDRSFFGNVKKAFNEFNQAGNEISRGALKSIIGLGQSFGGLLQSPQQRQEASEDVEDFLLKAFPSEENELTSKRERFGEMAPLALSVPGGPAQALLRTGLSVESEDIAKKMGFGKTGQTIAGLVPFVAPSPTRLLEASTRRQQQLIDFGRQMGMTEEQLTVAMQGDTWINRQLAQIAMRRGRTQEALRNTQRGLDTVLTNISTSPEAQNAFSATQTQNLAQNLTNSLHTLDNALVQQVMPDVQILLNNPVNGEEVINLYRKINRIASRLPEGDARQFGRVQETLRNAITDHSPQLGTDFALGNELYTNYARLRTNLHPSLVSDIVSSSKAIGAVVSLITGNYPHLAALSGGLTARKIASELLINPSLQNLQHKMIRAVNQNRTILANELLQEFREEVKKDVPEFYEETKSAKFPKHQEKANK